MQEETIDFKGKGYIEADRGKSFPKYYLWAQCNHFKKVMLLCFFPLRIFLQSFLSF